MSLVLSRRQPAPVRGLLLPILILMSLFASALSVAPTLAGATGSTADKAVCTCAHCPGGAKCCCRAKLSCPVRLP